MESDDSHHPSDFHNRGAYLSLNRPSAALTTPHQTPMEETISVQEAVSTGLLAQ